MHFIKIKAIVFIDFCRCYGRCIHKASYVFYLILCFLFAFLRLDSSAVQTLRDRNPISFTDSVRFYKPTKLELERFSIHCTCFSGLLRHSNRPQLFNNF